MNTYTGAPDECGRHWPEKLNKDGDCNLCIAERTEADRRVAEYARLWATYGNWWVKA